MNKKSIEFDRLKRESDSNQRLYELVARRLKDIELSGLLRTSNVRVLDAARPNFGPVRPNVNRMVMIALLFGVKLPQAPALGMRGHQRRLGARVRALIVIGHTPQTHLHR